MKIYAVADLHLSFSADKPMDVFGAAWNNHAERLKAAWEATVKGEDTVLIPGDISWAMTLEGAAPDLAFIGELPGQKILIRGNHEYWWNSVTKVRSALPGSIRAIQNDVILCGDYVIGGSRGWTFPGGEPMPGAEESKDRRIYERELGRMELSLKQMPQGKHRIFMTHFPPCDVGHPETEVTRLMERYQIETVVYGHLHGPSHKLAFDGVRNGVNYLCVAGDKIGFVPQLIADDEAASSLKNE